MSDDLDLSAALRPLRRVPVPDPPAIAAHPRPERPPRPFLAPAAAAAAMLAALAAVLFAPPAGPAPTPVSRRIDAVQRRIGDIDSPPLRALLEREAALLREELRLARSARQ